MKIFLEKPSIFFIAITLILGAACLGISPLLVRVSEVGPTSSAFWRSCLAIPLILILVKILKIKIEYKTEKTNYFLLALPGIFLGIDHAAWHHGIMLTTIANSTLFASMAPVFVVIYAYLFFSKTITFFPFFEKPSRIILPRFPQPKIKDSFMPHRMYQQEQHLRQSCYPAFYE